MLHALWLTPFVDCEFRIRRDGIRKWIRLARPPWFLKQLRDAAAESTLQPPQRSSASGLAIRCLCIVDSSNQAYQSSAHYVWSPQIRLQHALYQLPTHGFSLAVAKTFTCAEPVPSLHRRSRNAIGGVAKVSVSERIGSLYVPHWDGSIEPGTIRVTSTTTSECCDVGEVLRCEFLGRNLAIDEVPALLLPRPIFELVIKSAWTDLFCLGRWLQSLAVVGWPNPFGTWPPERWWKEAPSDFRPPEVAQVQAGTCHRIAGLLQAWAPTVLADIEDDDERAGEQMDLAEAITSLSSWAHAAETRRGDYLSSMHTNLSSAALIHTIRLARRLSGGAGQVVDVAERVICLLAGSDAASLYAGDLASIGSPSTLTRHEFTLDLAIMMCEGLRIRSLNQAVVRWAWTDSSPQQSKDWIWHQSLEIALGDIVGTFGPVLEVTTAAEQLGDEEAEAALACPPVEWQPLLNIMKTNLRLHITPPTAVGVGHRGLAHKAAALVHSHYMELQDRDLLSKSMCTFISHTSDMGVELGLPDLMVTSAGSLLPVCFEGMGICNVTWRAMCRTLRRHHLPRHWRQMCTRMEIWRHRGLQEMPSSLEKKLLTVVTIVNHRT